MDINEGDYLALCEDKLLVNDNSLDGVIGAIAKKIKESGKTMVSIYYGEDVNEEQGESTLAMLQAAVGDDGVEFNLYQGNQPVYYYIISVE